MPLSTAPGSGPASPGRWRTGTLVYTSGGLALLFCWLLWGDFAWAMRDRSIPSVVQLLFKRFGASDTLVGILFASLPSAIGLIVGPVVGYRSDRLRSRWGRRIPYLVVPTPFIVLSMAGLAFAPRLGGELHRLPGLASIAPDLVVLGCLVFFWSTFEIACTVANAVFGALVNDVVPQAVVGRFFGLFRAFSLLAGIILNYWVMGKAESHYAAICLGVGLLYGVGFTLMCLKVREGSYPPPPAPPVAPPGGAGGLLPAVRAYFRESLGHPYYRWFFAATILFGIAAVPFNVYSLFYAKSIGMGIDLFFRYIAATFVVSLVLAYPLGALVDRFHPLRVSLVVLGFYAAAMAWGIWRVRDASSFAVVLVAHTVLSGTLCTTASSLGQRLLPQAKFAEIASAGGVLGSLAMMAIPPALGVVLDHTGHRYAYLFHAGLALSLGGLAAGAVLHRKFLALGGPARYRAPE